MKIIKLFILSITCLVIFSPYKGFTQMTVTPSSSAVAMVTKITGAGVSTLNQVLSCDSGVACGTFNVTPGTLMGGAGTTIWGIDSGILLTTGKALQAAGPESGTTSTYLGRPADPTMAPLAYYPASTGSTFDRCELAFDVIPQGDTLSFNYIFGSEEYIHSTCGIYDDAFAFFISGTGIAGTQNMALVPGTTIPVIVNSINGGSAYVVGGYGTYSNCTSIAAGSPFTAYYVDNTGSANFAYRGYTTKLAAVHSVTACDTYHLRLAIVDAGNAGYDSGVFIEAGSLSSNSYHFDHTALLGATIGGVPNTIVKGCNPTSVSIIGTHANSTSTNLTLSFGGTAINGTDVTTVPGTITMPADSTHVSFNVSAIPTPPGGSKVFTIYLYGGTCASAIVDSISINILDTPSAYILTSDTSICSGQHFNIITSGTPGLNYSWAPGSTLSSTSIAEPLATPTATTTYTMTASLAGSGCPPIVRDITVTIAHDSVNIITPDTSVCAGTVLTFNAYATPGTSYNWTPITGLSSSTVLNPVVTPFTTTTYTISASLPGGCIATDTVRITIIPGTVSILTPPTTICIHDSLTLDATGSAGAGFIWSPSSSLSNATIFNPVATPTVTTTYTVTGSITGGLCPAVAFVTITVANPTVTILTPNTTICNGGSVSLNVTGSAGSTYSWTPATGLSNPAIINPVASPSATTQYFITASTPGIATCIAKDSVTIFVNTDTLITNPTSATICIGDSVQLHAFGSLGMVYNWSPASNLNNANISNPFANPTTNTTYTVTGTTATGACPIKATVAVTVANPTLTILTPDTSICAGISFTLRGNGDPTNNYNWSPATSLSNPHAMQPIATPTVTTTYFDTVFYPGLPTCQVVQSVTVTILPPLTVLVSAQILNCNSGLQLQCQPGGNNYTYLWSGPSSFGSSIQNPSLSSLSPANDGTYSVFVTDITNGCVGQDSTVVSIDSSKNSYLTNVTPNMTVPYGTKVHLNADNEIYYWWRPANGTISDANINNPFVTPTDSVTTYTVYGMDSLGCLDSAFVTIHLTYGNIGIPTAFSPNGDGLNDVFRPVGFTYQHLVEFRIFNRWGNELFFSNNVENGWDGTYKGVQQDMDTYFYMMIVAFPDGSNRVYKGDLTLVR